MMTATLHLTISIAAPLDVALITGVAAICHGASKHDVDGKYLSKDANIIILYFNIV